MDGLVEGVGSVPPPLVPLLLSPPLLLVLLSLLLPLLLSPPEDMPPPDEDVPLLLSPDEEAPPDSSPARWQADSDTVMNNGSTSKTSHRLNRLLISIFLLRQTRYAAGCQPAEVLLRAAGHAAAGSAAVRRAA